MIGAQTSCGAEVLRGAGALAREHSGKRTTSVLEPALSEAEGCRTASPSHCHSERLQPRICCWQSNWYVWCGPSSPRDSVPDDVGVSVPRSCWHRLREDSLVRHPFAFCAKGGSHPMWRTPLSARSHSRRCRRERPRSCSPYHCHPGGSGVLRSRRTPDEGPTHFRATPHAPAKFGAEQAGNGTTSSP